MIRYDIYVMGRLYRSTYNERHILEIVMPYDEGDYEIKTIYLQ